MFSFRNPFSRSLRLKIVVLSIIVEVVMLGLLLANSLRLLDQALINETQTRVEEILPLLDAALSARVFEQDTISVNEILEKLIQNRSRSLKYIVVYNTLGETYAKAGDIDVDNMPTVDIDVNQSLDDSIFDVKTDLKLEGIVVGSVRAGLSISSFREARDSVFRQGLLIASAEVLLTFIFLSLVGYFLTRHITQLLEATRTISKGDYSQRVPIKTEDEIGLLADNFNAMAEAINVRMNQIKESERALFNEKERAITTLFSIEDGVITIDPNRKIDFMNPAAEALIGCRIEDAEGKNIQSIFTLHTEGKRESVLNPAVAALLQKRSVKMKYNTVLVDSFGSEHAVEYVASPILNETEELIGAVLVLHDVTITRKLADQMAYQASHDPLTGLTNRREFEHQLSLAIDSTRGTGEKHAMCYMDLDQFKVVNDTSGHLAGDELLRQIATLLGSTIRGSDVFSRLGGDEFGVLFLNCDIDHAKHVADTLRSKLSGFVFAWEDKTYKIGVSVGIVPIDENTTDVTQVFSAADVACYMAKEMGKNLIHVYEFEDATHTKRRGELDIATSITDNINSNKFELYMQRIASLDNNAENSEEMFELLFRVRGENGVLQSPTTVVPAAERYRLMPDVDRWVIAEALSLISKTQGVKNSNTVYCINVSGQSLVDDGFKEFITDILDKSKVKKETICFELTETHAIANLSYAIEFIKELRAKGCRFSLDDFGSGLCSFGYLKNLPVDFLKIDGSFVKDILLDPADRAMVESINNIGHVMGIITIAEHVESEDVKEALAEIGVDYVQGYAIHRPEKFS